MPSRVEFDALIQRMLDHVDELDNQRLRRVLDLIGDAHGEVLRRMVSAKSFETAYLESLERELGEVLDSMMRRIGDEFGTTAKDVVTEGTRAVAQPLSLIRVETMFPAIPQGAIDKFETFAVRRIGGASKETLGKITREIDLVAVGAKKRAEAIEAVGATLKDSLTFKDIRTRAETIVNTEVKRFRSQVKWDRMQEAVERIPDMEKWWLTAPPRVRNTHKAAGRSYAKGSAIPLHEDFYVGGHKCSYPRDWALPAKESVNCKCEAVMKVPDSYFEEG